jgi:hypothetical protein
MLETAKKLSRKNLVLRFQHNEGFKGLCRTDSSGTVIIDLEPELQFQNEEEFLRVFLHEISHAKTDTFIPMKLEVSDRIPVSRNAGYELRENRADKQASTWLKYAEEHRDTAEPYFEGCLWSLYNSTF